MFTFGKLKNKLLNLATIAPYYEIRLWPTHSPFHSKINALASKDEVYEISGTDNLSVAFSNQLSNIGKAVHIYYTHEICCHNSAYLRKNTIV